MKRIIPAITLLLAGLVMALPAAAQNCPSIEYRIWRSNQPVEWYNHGETLQLTPGEEVHVYIHTPGRAADSHYSTSAEIGYPSNFGFREDSRAVRQHLRMEAQNADDRRSGRIRLVAEAPGETRLGYRVEGVKSPGDMSRIDPACRSGAIQFSVGGSEPATAPPQTASPSGTPDYVTAGDAANELVDLLYRGLLRRERGPSDPDDFVRQAMSGKAGLERLAETMTGSPEFRRQALQRTDARGGVRGGTDALIQQLLDDIYRDLYGYLTPSREARRGDLADLDTCLSNSRDAQDACERLGRNLVDSELFYEQNRRWLDAITDARRGGRRY